ncbi:unnamed protein product [Chondrus crispus]|uniref:Protoporphyrinogen oxidase n=1 Tax=Chondrus crispus TaxID=2769 RepID=R7QII2_CHOCR|nr:unnamed protein product [Chondrus crispus]CDF38327.1 unnamed protein product [Chondrus crispus]|eukprot:XP_005718212.1 unnamed protein product [Chondrus crispus]
MAVAEGATPAPAAASATPSEVDALVIGSGISGSSLAFTLSQASPATSLLLTEARPVVGGNVISRNERGYTWEEGPNTFQPAPHIIRMAVDLGLRDDIVLADHTLPRFVYWDQRLFALPLSPNDIPTFRLLSLPGAIRAGLGAAGFVMPPPKGREESIKDFITRHLGAEVFQKMIDPFVSGVYAGDPSKLSMSAAFKKIYALQELGMTQGIVEGAIIRIQQKKKEAPPPDPELPTWKGGALGSFRKGLGMLPQAVAERLGDRVKLSWKLVSLGKESDGRYRATYETPEGTKTVIARSVAITAPANATAGILGDLAPGIKAIEEINYPTVWSITLAYPKNEFREPLSGFGNLIPRSMGIRTLGTIWSSCLFPGRAPEGMELLLSYIGGAQDAAIKELTEDEVVATVDADIKKILMKDGSEVKPVVVGARKWDRAIPQYNIGYWDIMGKAEEAVKEHPGIFLGGNYTSGVAFGDCVQWGIDTAPKVAEYVAAQAAV